MRISHRVGWTALLSVLWWLPLPCAGQIIQSPPAVPKEPEKSVTARNPKVPEAKTAPIILFGPMETEANETTPPSESALTVEAVQLQLKELEEDPALEKSQKDKLRALYQQALTDLNEAAAQRAKAEELAKKTQSVPAQIEAAKATKQKHGQPPDVVIPPELSLAQLQQELATREEELNRTKTRLDEAVNALKNITAQRGEQSQLRKTAHDRLAEIEKQLKNLPANGEAAVSGQTQAERAQLRARSETLRANVERLDKEDAWRQARTDLLPLERDLAALEAARWEAEVKRWRQAVNAARQLELDQQKKLAEAQAEAAQAFDEYARIEEHAKAIVQLTKQRQDTAAQIPGAVKRLDRTESQLSALNDSFKQSRERVEAAGDTMNVGILLRLQQQKLPDVRGLERHRLTRQDLIQQYQLHSYEISDRTKELANVPKAAEAFIDTLIPAPDAEQRQRLQPFIEGLLETEKSQLDHLNADYNDLLDKLWRLDKVEKQLIEETESYSQFISEHVLWIRSTDELWIYSAGDYQSAVRWLLRPGAWWNVASALGQDFWSHPGLWTLSIALLGLLLIEQRKMRLEVDDIGKTVAKRAATEFRPTLRVLVYTVLIASIWPLTMCWVGYRLFHQLDAPVFVSAVGSALFVGGLIFFPVELLRQSCRTNGLAQCHFVWPAPVVTMIRRNLRWLKWFAPPLAILAALFQAAGSEAVRSHDSLARVCFVVALLMAAWFLHRVLRPSGATFRALVAYHQGGWVDRFKYVFYAAGVLVPVTLACLAILGYYYTSEQLVTRLYATAWLVLTVIMFDALIQRWLLVTRRRLAMDQLRQRREAALAQAADSSKATPSVVPNPADALNERLDVTAMNDQTRHLIRSMLVVGIVVGLWGVWVDVLPALAVLKKVKIHALTIERVVEEPAPAVTQTPATETDSSSPADQLKGPPAEPTRKTVEVPITLADLMLSVVLLIVAIVAARNLPGMLEMVILQRLPIDNAARYAITTLAQYGLMIFGVSAAFYVIGLRWQNVQWLAAALMVGLGFGLQEIFANFFSGLIVLLERPVRVGDIVTVGNVSGVVSRIRMRATTITDWERKEMIIPNKDLITGQVLNWTLSDTIQRVYVEVGIAFGSDTEKATEVLYRVLRSHPEVMTEPGPVVTFSGFGSSTLNFQIRCFLPSAAVKLATTHELHVAIDRAFREAGIEMAFPQMDLHVRSVEATLPIRQAINPINNQFTPETALSKGA